MAKILMYSTQTCPYCTAAEQLLRSKGITEIEKIMVDLDPARLAEMTKKTGRRTVPQIFINTQHIGGYDELKALECAGKLNDIPSSPC